MHFDPTFRDDSWQEELWQQAMVPLKLPDPGDYGRLRIVRQAAQYLPLFGRQLRLSAAVDWTLAYEDDTLWMSDTPQERLMMLQGSVGMRGHVLVAGGGLGLYAQYLRYYRRAERVTIVERNPDVIALLQTTLGADRAITLVHSSIEQFIDQVRGQPFDGCYLDIHPTLDPRWLPGLHWLRDQCAGHVAGPLRIWGYAWMLRELVKGLEQTYLPLLRNGYCFDDDWGHRLAQALPAGWEAWPVACLHHWLVAYAQRIAWPGDSNSCIPSPCASANATACSGVMA